MNLDEFIRSLRSSSKEKHLQELVDYIDEWKHDDRNVSELEIMIERFFGYIWLFSEDDFSKSYGIWSAFRSEVIERIGGMTMNERLFSFCLSELFDTCRTNEDRQAVYEKVHATP